jgi:uncharacterized membrane protein YbaN (DUF454 family)
MSLLNNTSNNAELEPPPTRPWLLVGGWLLFALGLIGIALPLLPTTVFWIGAVWCWSRSAPRLTNRILSHPRFGQPVSLFIKHGQISRSGKWMALGGMAISYALLQLLSRPNWTVSLWLGLTLVLIIIWLWKRPEPLSEQCDLTFKHLTQSPDSTYRHRSGG